MVTNKLTDALGRVNDIDFQRFAAQLLNLQRLTAAPRLT